MDIGVLSSLSPLVKSVCYSIGAVAGDDIAVIFAVLWGIVEYTKQNIRKNGELENRAIPEILKGMAKNRLKVGGALCAAFTLASVFLPAAMPVITGGLCLAAGAAFALECTKDYHEMAGQAANNLHKHQSVPEYVKSLLKKVFPHNENEATKCDDHSLLPECKESEDHVVADAVNESVKIDMGLTLELCLFAGAIALHNAKFQAALHASGGSLLQTFAVFCIPVAAASIATLVVVAGGAFGLAKLDNLGYACANATPESIRNTIVTTASKIRFNRFISPVANVVGKVGSAAKQMNSVAKVANYVEPKADKGFNLFTKYYGKLLNTIGGPITSAGPKMGKVLKPIGITLLMGIAGKMFLEGAETFAPQLAESLPSILTTEAGEIAAGIVIGTPLFAAEKTVGYLKSLRTANDNQKATFEAEYAATEARAQEPKLAIALTNQNTATPQQDQTPDRAELLAQTKIALLQRQLPAEPPKLPETQQTSEQPKAKVLQLAQKQPRKSLHPRKPERPQVRKNLHLKENRK